MTPFFHQVQENPKLPVHWKVTQIHIFNYCVNYYNEMNWKAVWFNKYCNTMYYSWNSFPRTHEDFSRHVLQKLASHVCSVSLNFYHCEKYWNLQLNQVKQDIRGTSTVVLGSDTSFVSRAALSDLDAFGKSQGWVPHFPRWSTGSLQFLMSHIEASLPARSRAKAYISWCGSTRWYADGKALWC